MQLVRFLFLVFAVSIGIAPAQAAHELTRADAQAWLDGLVPNALAQGDLANAVVIVVKDGEVLVAAGYGHADVDKRTPVDPAATLFRPGSISKLFTWTAVMQLVEAGKLDLDADVNGYLDFPIPPFDGKPVTLRQLMSHSAGFEDTGKHLFAASADRLMPLGDWLKRTQPPRRFAPGTVPAYSNWGTALAGYIVERASGLAWDDYVEQRIFAPLGMRHATFRQPLPPALAPLMAGTYRGASQPARAFELVGPAPAGSLSVSGTDMARFMLAFLDDGHLEGGRILSPESVRQMHTPGFRPLPGLPAMGLGFIGDEHNGQTIFGHSGATEAFQSELRLLSGPKVGLFLSIGGGEGTAALRRAIYDGFLDRYYPAPTLERPTVSTARAHGAELVGRYESSRSSFSGLFAIVNLLGQSTIAQSDDGTLTVSAFRDPAGNPKRWREVGDRLWQEVGGNAVMAARVENGRVVGVASSDVPPVMMLMPVSASRSAAWNVPLLIFAIAVLVLTAVLWPVAALVRRRYRQPVPVSPALAPWRRAALAAALVGVVLVGVWLSIIASVDATIVALDGGIDTRVRLAQLAGLAMIAGAAAATVYAVRGWREGGRWLRIVLALACIAMAWFVVSLHTLGFALRY
jgi:CubicO group peptidase (beta-lactamase class C family)